MSAKEKIKNFFKKLWEKIKPAAQAAVAKAIPKLAERAVDKLNDGK